MVESNVFATFEHNTRVARLKHRCEGCDSLISQGSEYCEVSILNEDGFHNMRFHALNEAVEYFVRHFCQLDFEPARLVYYDQDPNSFILAIVYDEDDTPLGHLIVPKTTPLDIHINRKRVYFMDRNRIELREGGNQAEFEYYFNRWVKVDFVC